MENILITGANFSNKGAQAMLFIVVDELKKRIPDLTLYFAIDDPDFDKNFAFEAVFMNWEVLKIALEGRKAPFYISRCLKNGVKRLLGKRTEYPTKKLLEFGKIEQKLTLIVDIGGYSIGSKWTTEGNERTLDYVRVAQKNSIPMIFMPQSFGPFDFKLDKDKLDADIRQWLRYPFIIYARESDGYNGLIREYGLCNVKKSDDLVLQSKGIDLSNIFRRVPEIEAPIIEQGHNVAVIPNLKCLEFVDLDTLINLYDAVINTVLNSGKQIYIIRHATEDLDLCKKVKELFQDNSSVHLIEDDLSCIEFDQFVRRFEFVVCSRYHGIVHAYKNYIPCLVLGWAIKYKELAESVGQGYYSFDLAQLSTESHGKNDKLTKNVIDMVEKMISSFSDESEIVKEHVMRIQENNCFDAITDWYKKKRKTMR